LRSEIKEDELLDISPRAGKTTLTEKVTIVWWCHSEAEQVKIINKKGRHK